MDPQKVQRRGGLGVALACAGLLLISLESVGIRVARTSPWDAAFWLGAFTAVAMLTSLRARDGRWPTVDAPHARWLVLTACLQAASTACFILALSLTTVASTMVIFATTPAVAALVAAATLGERIGLRLGAGIAGATVGGVLAVSGSLAHGRWWGEACALAAVASYAANLALWRRFPALDRQLVIGAGGLVLALAAFWPAQPANLSPWSLLVLAALGLVTAPLGRVLLASSTKLLPASQVGLLTPVETIAATAWAWMALDEVPGARTVIGGLIVIAAVVLGLAK